MGETTFERMARLYKEGRLNDAAIRRAVPSLLTEEEAETILNPDTNPTQTA